MWRGGGGGGRRLKCSFHHHSFDPIDCTMAGWYGVCGCQLFETLTTPKGRPSLHSPPLPLPSPPLPSPFHSCPPFPPRGWPDPSLSSLLPPTELSCFPCKQVTSLLKKGGGADIYAVVIRYLVHYSTAVSTKTDAGCDSPLLWLPRVFVLLLSTTVAYCNRLSFAWVKVDNC